MKRSGAFLMMVLAGLVLAGQVLAGITPDDPYITPITNRNLFGLKPPPDPNDPANLPPPPPLPNIYLAGITTLLGNKRAVLRAPRPAKPPEPAKEVSLMLSEGDSEEGVKVLQINVADGTVKIMNGSTEQLLDIKKNAPKPGAGGAPAAPPAAPPIPVPRMNPAPGSGGVAPAVTGLSRPVRGAGSTSSRDVPGSGSPMSVPTASEPTPVPAEVAAINYAGWYLRDKAKVDAKEMPPYPPTEATELIDSEANGGTGQGQSGPPRMPGM
ncbi:MAG: hypothetical protein RLY20_1 [Verrucomicrobiota bacterium]|jgi:hypothetical protein